MRTTNGILCAVPQCRLQVIRTEPSGLQRIPMSVMPPIATKELQRRDSTKWANNGHRRIELGSADLEPQGFCTRQKFGVDSEIFSSSDVISIGTSAKSGVLR
jgi:hypothetical protein